MSDYKLIEAIQTVAGTRNKDEVRLLQCNVKSVDLDNRTCEVITTTGNASVKFTAKLQAGVGDGLLIEPVVDRTVYVLFSKYTLPFVVQYSDIASYMLNGDEFGGIVKVIELTSKLNAIENDINVLKTVFSSWVTVPNDGGAALKAITSTWFGQQLSVTTQSEIENKTVQHGD